MRMEPAARAATWSVSAFWRPQEPKPTEGE